MRLFTIPDFSKSVDTLLCVSDLLREQGIMLESPAMAAGALFRRTPKQSQGNQGSMLSRVGDRLIGPKRGTPFSAEGDVTFFSASDSFDLDQMYLWLAADEEISVTVVLVR